MICSKCGEENPAEAKFCGKCAAPLTTVTSGLNIGIIVATIFVPIVGIIMGLIYMNDANSQKKAAGRMWLYVGIGALALYCLFGVIKGMME